MIYGYMLENKQKSINESLDTEFNNFKVLSESFQIYLENDTLAITENSLKSYWYKFITKIRELIRILKIKLKEIFMKFSEKVLTKYIDQYTQEINDQLGKLSDDKFPIKVRILYPGNKVNGKDSIFNIILDFTSKTYEVKLDGSEQQVKESEKALESAKGKLDFCLKSIERKDEIFKEKEVSMNNEKSIYELLGTLSRSEIHFKKALEIGRDRLVGLEKNLSKLENINQSISGENGSNYEYLNNMKKIYENAVETTKIYLQICEKVCKVDMGIRLKNMNRIKAALGINNSITQIG